MLQFYFLAVLLNVIAGLIFIYSESADSLEGFGASSEDASFDVSDSGETGETGADEPKKAADSGFKSLAVSFLGDKTLQLVVGILSFLTGLMKLLSPIQYDIAIIGDLVPALAGIAAGAVLLLDWYQERSDSELPLPDAILTMYTSGRKYLGIFCVIAAVLHFIFPRVLFL